VFRTRKFFLPLLASTLVATGCDTGTGPAGAVQVRLSQSAQASQSLGPMALLSTSSIEGASTGGISLSSVSSIQVSVTGVHALPVEANEAAPAAWVTLDLTGDAKEVELLSLSATSGVTIAAGALPDGQYSNLRLLVGSAKITFPEAVTIGSAANPRTVAAGEYDLLIPSGAQTGIKVPVSFSVSRDENEVVTVVFDGAASVQSLQSTQQGIQMSPVLTSRSN
jgi:hypothetical protein